MMSVSERSGERWADRQCRRKELLGGISVFSLLALTVSQGPSRLKED